MPTEDKAIIKLDKYWRIESDTRSWNLIYDRTHEVNPVTRKHYQGKDITYHANLKYALISYLEESMSGAKDIQGVIDRIEQAEKNVEAALTKALKEA